VANLIPPVVPAGTMADAQQPTLAVGDALLLRPWVDTDAAAVVRAFANPDIQRWHFRRFDTEAAAREWIAECNQAWHAERGAHWAIAPPTGEAIGRVTLYTALVDGYGELSYWVMPEARERGVATRAVICATEWAHDLGLHRIQLQHSTRNPISGRVARAAGFVSEGIRREANLHDDGWHDMHMYAHLPTE
jgi:RimJ/RimL family protein N-acetyltransferase